MASLEGKVIAVTGDAKSLDQMAQEIRTKYKVGVITAVVDDTDSDQVDRWIASTLKHFSKLSGSVNLAGFVGKEFGKKAAHEVSDKDFDLVMAINVRGVMACQRAQLRHIEDGGSIVNAASVSGKMGVPNALFYAASKHAVIGLTRVAAAENGYRKVRVNAIAP
jgi:NAD(P)-dependent dehydrogenase (short-subunit alcohol dehydrogenase family)